MILSDIAIAPADVAAHYDSLDRFYRDIWGEHVHHGYWEKGHESIEEAVIHLSEVLATWLRLQSGERVLDVGCGYGGTSRYLANTYAADVLGFTLSTQQQEFASRQSVQRGSVVIHCQDFLTQDLQSASFDALISIECLEHIEDKQAAFNEAFRLLKPGKRMAIAVWASTETPNRAQRRLLQDICREGRLPGMPSGSEYTRYMERAGFRVIRRREIAREVKKTWTICAQRLAQRLLTDSTYRAFILKSSSKDKIFALTLLKIMAAFQTKAMKYWIYAAEKPADLN